MQFECGITCKAAVVPNNFGPTLDSLADPCSPTVKLWLGRYSGSMVGLIGARSGAGASYGGSGILIGGPLGCPSLEVFPASLNTGRIPKTSCRDHLSFLVRECLWIPLEELERHCRRERHLE